MSDPFETAVKEHLRPLEGNFNYQNILQSHLDSSRFYSWVGQVAEYRAISGSTVLSSGCGSAGDVLVFLEKGASEAHGIEVDRGLAKLARQRFQGTPYEPQVGIAVYDGSLLPYRDNRFDVIFSMHVIEHTRQPDLYLSELFRVLRPGGIILLDLPNRHYWREQHTLLPLIHLPSVKTRDAIIDILLSKPICFLWPEQTAYKLATLRGFQFPFPSDLIRTLDAQREAFSLELRDAFFFANTSQRASYGNRSPRSQYDNLRWWTTFRVVIGKTTG